MKVDGWQANTTGEDVISSLQGFGAVDVVRSEGEEYPEFTWTSYVDTDEDVLDLLCIALWYNDRSDEDIRTIRRRVKDMLETYGRAQR